MFVKGNNWSNPIVVPIAEEEKLSFDIYFIFNDRSLNFW